VIDMIRGKNVAQALAILQFTNKRATENIEKCLRSAIANATFKAEQDNIAIDPDDLWVKTCFVDMGPHKNRRRVRPAPQGRAYREQRYYCHLTIQLTSEQPANAKPVGKRKKVANISKASTATNVKPKKNAPAVTANAENVKAAPVTETAEVSQETPVEQVAATTPQVETADTAATETTQTVETAPAANETATDGEAKKVTKKTPAKNKTESTSEEKKTD